MPNRLKTRKKFSECIKDLINKKTLVKKSIERQKQRLEQFEKCESFLRGLLRTHSRLPKRGDKKPQYFFQNQKGDFVLVEEFLGKNTEQLLPNMPRCPLSETQKAKMKDGKLGFVIFVSPLNDFEVGHARFIVNFDAMKSEKI
jgi:hypothetical protein